MREALLGTVDMRSFYASNGAIEHVEYKHVGGPVIYVSAELIMFPALRKNLKHVAFGPYTYTVLDYMPERDAFMCIREHMGFEFIVIFLYRASRILRLTYSRTILTLAVWKLAEYHPSRVPSWRDIHAVQYVSRKLPSWKRR